MRARGLGRGWRIAATAIVAVAALVLSGVSTWGIWRIPSDWQPDHTSAAAAPRSTSRVAAEAAILQRRAAAVLSHNRTAFLADVDPSIPGLRTAQSAVFTGLEALPFSRFSYRATGQDLDPAGVQVPAGVPVNVAAVVESSQLQDWDTAPAAEALGVAFVLRDGRWWWAGQSQSDNDLPEGGDTQPWDRGPVAVATGQRTLVVGPASKKSLLPTLAREADAAVRSDLRFWPSGHGHWSGRAVIYLPSNHAGFAAWLGEESTSDVLALEVPTYREISFDSDGGGIGPRTGSRVIINPAYVDVHSSDFMATLRHEVSHVAAQPITGDGTPSWFVEGLAEYVAYRTGSPSQAFFNRGVDGGSARQIKAGTYRIVLPPSRGFYSGSDTKVEEAYTTGFFTIAYIQHRYGEVKLHQLAVAIGKASSYQDTARVQKSALHSVLGVTAAQLEAGATQWLRGFRLD